MTHIFKSPKFYKELRMQYGPDKAISNSEENSEAASVRRGSRPQAPSFKQAIQETVPWNEVLEASSSKPQAPSDSSSKLQASSPKQQASSFKPQASSSMIRDPRNIWKRFAVLGPRVSVKIKLFFGCVKCHAIWCGENLIFLLFVTFNSTVKNVLEVL